MSNTQYENDVGTRFGSWTLVDNQRIRRVNGVAKNGQPRYRGYYKVRCDCGTEEEILLENLRRGLSQQCSACRNKLTQVRSTQHGRAATPIYSIWNMMKQRTQLETNESWDNYGGRGIDVDPRWLKFENFFADMGDKPHPKATLERINNDKGYWPGNVRWACHLEQGANKRNTHRFEYKGHSLTLREWELVVGVKFQTLASRLYAYGLSVEAALTQPVLMPDNKTIKFVPKPVPDGPAEIQEILKQHVAKYKMEIGWVDETEEMLVSDSIPVSLTLLREAA